MTLPILVRPGFLIISQVPVVDEATLNEANEILLRFITNISYLSQCGTISN